MAPTMSLFRGRVPLHVEPVADTAELAVGAIKSAPAPRAVATEAGRLPPAVRPTLRDVAGDAAKGHGPQGPFAAGTTPVAGAVVAPPLPQSASAALCFTAAGEILRSLFRGAPNDEPPGAVIRPAKPLLAGPPLAPDALAGALQASIARSGLFYESHLADWALANYPRPELDQEPQSALAAQPAAADANGTPAPALPPETTQPLIRHQLDALATGHFGWEGEAWPGQHVALVIEGDPAQRDAPEPPWRTRLRLDLPRLGRVDIDIALHGRSLALSVRPAAAAAANALDGRVDELASALRAREFLLSPPSVRHATA
jgi:hypothetical protein